MDSHILRQMQILFTTPSSNPRGSNALNAESVIFFPILFHYTGIYRINMKITGKVHNMNSASRQSLGAFANKPPSTVVYNRDGVALPTLVHTPFPLQWHPFHFLRTPLSHLFSSFPATCFSSHIEETKKAPFVFF